MALQPVEWVLVVYYGPEAHRATYGRQVQSKRYTKDYIQLSRKKEFLEAVRNLFGVDEDEMRSVPLTYVWPVDSTPGSFVFQSGDRPHLKWETSLGAPQVWKMSRAPSDALAETIPGDPSHLDFPSAENEFASLASRGAGQPYLLAIKLRDEPNKLHLRVYLENPSDDYAWADLRLAPQGIQALTSRTSQQSALAWSTFLSGGVPLGKQVDDTLSRLTASDNPFSVISMLHAASGRALANYLRQPGYGLFFDPTQNHDAWLQPASLPDQVAQSVGELLDALEARFPPMADGDAAAETLEADPDEVEAFRDQIERERFEVPDATATVKTRGSAQKAFADEVKSNYGFQCAITGIETRDFLVAAHIVPWSKDHSIRLDPSNGICLSLLVDRAFEKGYLLIADDHSIRIDWDRVGDDHALRTLLEPYEGRTLSAPAAGGPKLEYLQRRRVLVMPTE